MIAATIRRLPQQKYANNLISTFACCTPQAIPGLQWNPHFYGYELNAAARMSEPNSGFPEMIAAILHTKVTIRKSNKKTEIQCKEGGGEGNVLGTTMGPMRFRTNLFVWGVGGRNVLGRIVLGTRWDQSDLAHFRGEGCGRYGGSQDHIIERYNVARPFPPTLPPHRQNTWRPITYYHH